VYGTKFTLGNRYGGALNVQLARRTTSWWCEDGWIDPRDPEAVLVTAYRREMAGLLEEALDNQNCASTIPLRWQRCAGSLMKHNSG
jgi:hypothetical protein